MLKGVAESILRPYRDISRLSIPVRRSIPFLVVLLFLNAFFNSVSLAMVLPILEFLSESAMGDGETQNYSKLLSGIIWITEKLNISDPFIGICIITIAVFACKAAISIYYVYFQTAFAQRVRLYWIEYVAEYYLHAPYSLVSQRKHGVVANNIIREPTEAARFIFLAIQFAADLAVSLAIIVSLLLISWQVVLGIVLFGAILLYLLRKPMFGLSLSLGSRNLKYYQQIMGAIHEMVLGMKELRIQVAEEQQKSYLLEIANNLKRNRIRLQVLKESPKAIGEFIVISVGIGLLAVAHIILGGSVMDALPEIGFFVIAISRLVPTISGLVSGRIAYVNKMPSVHLLLELANDPAYQKRRAKPSESDVSIGSIDQEISFEDVTFSFKAGQPVLKDLTLSFPASKTTVLLGESGAGKSTVLDLLARIYSPDSGVIRCGKDDIQEYSLGLWRKRLGYVAQEPLIFNTTISENIALGREGVDDKSIERAAITAGLDTFLSDRANGLDTIVGNQGLALSGGQRKRIAIARALAGEPDVVIFDETTSAFEERLEEEILEDIRARWPRLAIIMITHRVSAASRADQVIVLDKGQVAAAGPYSVVRSVVDRLKAN